VLRGAEHFIGGELEFPPGTQLKHDRFYRTKPGPCVSQTGITYCNCNLCKRLAFRRLTCKRKPERIGYHEQLFKNQASFVYGHAAVYEQIKKMYALQCLEYTDQFEEALDHHGDPHVKRMLRVEAWREMCDETGDNASATGTWHSRPFRWVMKKQEIAKPGKIPRGIMDLGVNASLLGFRVTAALKCAQSALPLQYLGGVIETVKAVSQDLLTSVFRKLINCSSRYYFVIFSDDSCLSIRAPDGTVHYYNVDISKCDASHGTTRFKSLKAITPDNLRPAIDLLVQQCSEPFTIQDSENSRNFVMLQPKRPMLYSGSTLTTVVNNNASMDIGLSIAETPYIDEDSLVAAAERAGYIITLERCYDYHRLQFLKHSPVIDTSGQVRPLLNLGVLLRLSGTCRGDLPGRGDLQVRAQSFQAQLLAGAYPTASFTLIDNMKATAGPLSSDACFQKAVDTALQYKIGEVSETKFHVDDEEVYARYNQSLGKDITSISPAQIHEINYLFGTAGYGIHVNTPALATILLADYGLSCCDSVPELPVQRY